nr:hypothetical protein [Celeribacter baekdonensis]
MGLGATLLDDGHIRVTMMTDALPGPGPASARLWRGCSPGSRLPCWHGLQLRKRSIRFRSVNSAGLFPSANLVGQNCGGCRALVCRTPSRGPCAAHRVETRGLADTRPRSIRHSLINDEVCLPRTALMPLLLRRLRAHNNGT